MNQHIIIFGPPGSGKGTQSSLIRQHYGLDHLSTGELLRKEIKEESPLGRIAKEYIDKGQLLPDDLIIEVIEHFMLNRPKERGLIFDGFPRTEAQAVALDRMMEKLGEKIGFFLELEVPDEELITRLLLRKETEGRSDDNEETIKKRLNVYHTTATPIANYYQNQGIRKTVLGQGSIEEITQRIFDVIGTV